MLAAIVGADTHALRRGSPLLGSCPHRALNRAKTLNLRT